jgi:hypothetical protein
LNEGGLASAQFRLALPQMARAEARGAPLATFHDDYMLNHSSKRMKEKVHYDYPIIAS